MQRKMTIGILLMLTLGLAACGGGAADTTVDESEVAPPTFEGFANRALPAAFQLQIGTLMLEETPHAVTPAQAQELLPLWQILRAVDRSSTASQAETEATLGQIEAALTLEQLAAIGEMNLTMGGMRDMMQELGIMDEDEFARRREQGDQEGPGGIRPPGGEIPGQGGRGMDLSPEEFATRQAERMNSGFGTALLDALIELLEARAAEL